MTRIDVNAQTTTVAPSLSDPERFLPAPARPAGPDRWIVDLAIGPFHHEAVLTMGPMWRSDTRCGRSIAWEPAVRDHDVLPWESLMPQVHGALVLEDRQLRLRAIYTPSGGWIGRLVDPLLRPIARRSIRTFLREVVHVMDSQVPVTEAGKP